MPLNKLDNFIKNTEGRILYVNPSDLDSTDSITNEGNSLAKPFKTVQRALIEAARFSFVQGNNNDITEKTTILLFPGEHTIDNRPGFAIYNKNNAATLVSPGGAEFTPSSTISLSLDSNFDLTQEDNILYKFNSVNGGVIVPRGTSIVGLDLRKTKIRPKYVPNPTDDNVPSSAIFRITGACYFWQFSIFDGNPASKVYTDKTVFDEPNQSAPRFSHNKLTVFEYADGVNPVNRKAYGNISDLDMYYYKVGNAYNNIRKIENSDQFPQNTLSFSKRSPEWEIVGAFASDPINISNIISGDGTTANRTVTVTTSTEHNLNVGTPIIIKNVLVADYNVSTFVQDIVSPTQFTYLLETIPINLDASPQTDNATVTVETDTVNGASPYIFNISLRSVWGMNGMHADGSKADGFRSMVVAQFTAVSLQRDDRAFVKYNRTSRIYDKVEYERKSAEDLPRESSSGSQNSDKVYHLDPGANYRPGWESSHIKVSNSAFIQVVSVFAIGFAFHFDMNTGADASITNSNSNFGQFALKSEGFRSDVFEKDDHSYVTGIIPPRAVDDTIEENIEWLSLDVEKTRNVANDERLYLFGFTSKTAEPLALTQGFRIGARAGDKLYLTHLGTEYSAKIRMSTSNGNAETSNIKEYLVTQFGNSSSIPQHHFFIGTHKLQTGEKVVVTSKSGNYPENLIEHRVYYAITRTNNSATETDLNDVYNATDNPDGLQSESYIKLAASETSARLGEGIKTFGGIVNDLTIISRLSEKESGEVASPIQWDVAEGQWYITVDSTANDIYSSFLDTGVGFDSEEDDDTKYFKSSDLSYIKRITDSRSLDEKLYKLRVVIPKESLNAKNPEVGFIIQESSSTFPEESRDRKSASANIYDNFDTITSLSLQNTKYNRNPKIIRDASLSGTTFTYLTERPHGLKVGDIVIVEKVQDDGANGTSTGEFNLGFNGSFVVTDISNTDNLEYAFKTSSTDIAGLVHEPGNFQNSVNTRDTNLPRVTRNNLKSNLYIYRTEVISEYIEDESDGVYHLYVLNASNAISNTFTDVEFTQNPVDLYPQLDRDNLDTNPLSASTHAKLSPIGDVVTNDLKKSITRETADIFCQDFGVGYKISSVTTTDSSGTITLEKNHNLDGLCSPGTITGGSGYTDGNYYNVRLLSGNSSFEVSRWNGATCQVQVSGNEVTAVKIQSGGSGYSSLTYTNDEHDLFFDNNIISGGSNAKITINKNVDVESYVGAVLQITGGGQTPDIYQRISSIGRKTITFDRFSTEQVPDNTQYAFITGPSISLPSSGATGFTTSTETNVAGTLTFDCDSNPHGLVKGNKITVSKYLATVSNNEYIVDTVISPTKFTVKANSNISVNEGYILKHGLSSNEGISNSGNENYGARVVPFYAGEYFKFVSFNSSDTEIVFASLYTSSTLSQRLKLGDLIQIDNEIIRISGNVTDTTAVVSRGYYGTKKETHDSGSLIKKVKRVPIEFRRPAILRASAHTFEYLGYGPGNYSTALPQVQTRTLTDREEFLSQAQERGGGAVVYTGMNNRGDNYTGNTRISATSGETLSYDIPKPTVTGEDPSKLSVAFDEVTVSERILVEGGTSGFVLSQFNGPVTLSRDLRVKGKTTLNSQLRITDDTNSDATTRGALIVKGGVGIAKNVSIGESVFLPDESKLEFGTNDDDILEIYSSPYNNGGNSGSQTYGAQVIKSASTNRVLRVQTDAGFVVEGTDGQNLIRALNPKWTNTPSAGNNPGGKGSVELYYLNDPIGTGDANNNDGLRLYTTGYGVTINGGVYATGVSTFTNNVHLLDSDELHFGGAAGDDGDLRIYHDGTSSWISDRGDGLLYLDTTGGENSAIRIISQGSWDNGKMAGFNTGGSVDLYYDNDLRLSTTGYGVTINGGVYATGVSTFTDKVHLLDNDKLHFGDGDDLALYHNGTNSFIDNDTGHLFIRNNVAADVGGNIYIRPHDNEEGIVITHDGSVDLYYINAKKFETTNTGVTITGIATATTFSGSLENNLTLGVSGTGLSGSATYNNSSATTFTVTSNATSENTGGTIVARDSNGGFSAGTITATFSGDLTGNVEGDLTGNADTATDADSADKIKTKALGTNSTNYLTFVANNNTNSAAESLYTDAGIYYNPSTNNLSVAGDITAFASDIRLKTDIQPLTSALDKTLSLNGFTYKFNETARKLGFDTEITYAGVSAQEVEKVLPEVVCPAPIDNKYKTVQYDKLVPLLIEAIKELSNKVEILEQKLEDK
jgi:hypothetical protein